MCFFAHFVALRWREIQYLCFSEFSNITVLDHTEWDLHASNICSGAKDYDYGTFFVTKQGEIRGIKLKHVSDYLMCYTEGRSRWVCIYEGSISNVATEIIDKKNDVLFPDLKNYPRENGNDSTSLCTAEWMQIR